MWERTGDHPGRLLMGQIKVSASVRRTQPTTSLVLDEDTLHREMGLRAPLPRWLESNSDEPLGQRKSNSETSKLSQERGKNACVGHSACLSGQSGRRSPLQM